MIACFATKIVYLKQNGFIPDSYRMYYLKFSSSIFASASRAAALFFFPLSVASSANFLVNHRSAAFFARVSDITFAPIAKILQIITSLHISAVNSHSHKPQRIPLNLFAVRETPIPLPQNIIVVPPLRFEWLLPLWNRPRNSR